MGIAVIGRGGGLYEPTRGDKGAEAAGRPWQGSDGGEDGVPALACERSSPRLYTHSCTTGKKKKKKRSVSCRSMLH